MNEIQPIVEYIFVNRRYIPRLFSLCLIEISPIYCKQLITMLEKKSYSTIIYLVLLIVICICGGSCDYLCCFIVVLPVLIYLF